MSGMCSVLSVLGISTFNRTGVWACAYTQRADIHACVSICVHLNIYEFPLGIYAHGSCMPVVLYHQSS